MSFANTLIDLLSMFSEEELVVIVDNQRSVKDFIGSFHVAKDNKILPLHPDIIARMAEFNIMVEEGHDLKPPAQFNLADLTFRSLLKKDEDCITSEEMRRRAVKMKGNFGLADAKNLLDQLNSHQDKRKDLRDKYIVLPDTFLRLSVDHLRVACLIWSIDCWCLGFLWLGFGWDSRVLFACSE